MGHFTGIKKIVVLTICISVVSLILLLSIFQIRVFIIQNILFPDCRSISNTGNWVACQAICSINGDCSVSLVSMKFPFPKRNIQLPSIDYSIGQGFYDNFKGYPIHLSAWSPVSDNLVINIVSSTRNDAIDFCVVYPNNENNEQFKCFSDSTNQPSGMFRWSMNKDNGIYSVQRPDGSFEITLFSYDLKVINQFSIPNENSDSTLSTEHHFYLEDNNIFYSIDYRNAVKNGIQTSEIVRTEIYKITKTSPLAVEKVFTSLNHVRVLSINDNGNYLLLNESGLPNQLNFKLFDVQEKIIVDEFKQEVGENQRIYATGSYCINNCRKIAIEEYVDHQNQILIISLDKTKYSLISNYQNIIGRLVSENSFICSSSYSILNKSFTMIKMCR